MEDRFLKYDEIILERLRVVHVDNEKVVGVLYNNEELKELKDKLHQYNFYFSTRSVDKHCSDDNRLNIHWVLPKLQGAPPQGVALNDHSPFTITKVVNKDCRRGRAYWKKNNECGLGEDVDVGKVRKRKPYRTIKSDCPAKMTIRHIVAYPQYAVSSDTTKKIKAKYANRLKQDMAQMKVVGEERFVVSVSRGCYHKGHHSDVPRNLPVLLHPLVAHYITSLVAEGTITSPRAIKTLVTQFSKETFNEDEASPNDRCFYPIVKDIRALLRSLVNGAKDCERNGESVEEEEEEEEVNILEPNEQACWGLYKQNDKLTKRDDFLKGQDFTEVFSSVSETRGKVLSQNDSEIKGVLSSSINGNSNEVKAVLSEDSLSRLLSSVDQPHSKIFTSNNESHSKIFSSNQSNKIFASNHKSQPRIPVLTSVIQPLTHIFTTDTQTSEKDFTAIDEPESMIIHKDECEGIVDDGTESLVMEKQIIVLSEGYITLHFSQDKTEDDCVTMQIPSPHNSPDREKVLSQVQSPFPQLVDVVKKEVLSEGQPPFPELMDVNTEKVKLLSALEQTFQQVDRVNDLTALKEALKCVEQASLVLKSTLNGK